MTCKKKLLLNEKVEVRQLEEGLRGSWHPGVVVDIADLCRSITYDDLLAHDGSTVLTELIHVTNAIDGNLQRHYVRNNYRGWIRPCAPQSQHNSSKLSLKFGTCVDAFFEDAWWEGVVLDPGDDTMVCSVYFPDEGDEHKFKVSDLRLTLEWNEFSDSWQPRGLWVLVNLVKEHGCDAQFVKSVWCRLRSKDGFLKTISEWTCGTCNLWHQFFMSIVMEIAVKSSVADHVILKAPACGGRKRVEETTNCKGSALFSLFDNSDAKGIISYGYRDLKLRPKRNSVPSHLELPGKETTREKKLTFKKPKLRSPTNFIDISHKFQAQDLCNEKELTTDLSKMQNELSMEGHANQAVNGCTNKIAELNNSVFMPSQEAQSLSNGGLKLDSVNISEAESNQSKVKGQPSVEKSNSDLPSMKKRKSGQDECKRIKKYCLRPQQVRKSPAVLLKRKFVSGSSTIINLMPMKDKLQGSDSTKRGKVSSRIVSHVQHKYLITKGTKVKPAAKLCRINATKLSISSQKLRRKGALNDLTNKKNYPVMRTRDGKISSLSSVENNSIPVIDTKNWGAVQTKANVIASFCHQDRPSANHANGVTLNEKTSQTQRSKITHFSCDQYDTACLACHGVGNLILCDHCSSSYHLMCIDLKDVPEGKWFCPTCRCGLCGVRDSSSDRRLFTNICHQCSRQYHVDCLIEAGFLFPRNRPSEAFCSQNCFELCVRLHRMLGIPNATNVEGLTWTLIRSDENDCNMLEARADTNCCVFHVCKLMRECFLPVTEPHHKRDLLNDVIFNSVSTFKRLDFRGFYIMVLQNQDKLISAALVRIHGQKLAEVPFASTWFKYRRQGMFRLLVLELQKMLTQLGIERLVLPATLAMRKTWESSFGFTKLSSLERRELLGFPLLLFQGTELFKKVLNKSIAADESHSQELQEKGGDTGGIKSNNGLEVDLDVRISDFILSCKLKSKVTDKKGTATNQVSI